MHNARPNPSRIYEPNIIHNPLKWFGIWTPDGWRLHAKRWGQAERLTVRLSGDGRTTFFPNALHDPVTSRIEWQDDLHLADDPFTDGGIYPCDPRVEYPPGRQRWAVSHTVLCFPVADHSLFTHEYTWDLEHGHLTTHFRAHVEREEVMTDDRDGSTVRVHHTPISRMIEGNVAYPRCNSAVRGVWLTPEMHGENLYTRRVIARAKMHNAVYGIAPRSPVTQVFGIYPILPDDSLDQLFDLTSRECINPRLLAQRTSAIFDIPSLGMANPAYQTAYSACYETNVSVPQDHFVTIDESYVSEIKRRVGAIFNVNAVGFAGGGAVGQDAIGYAGYDPVYDLDRDGAITAADVAIAQSHVGRRVRRNFYRSGYFGGDWFSTGCLLSTEHQPGIEVLLDYEYGGGYDADSGTIQLLKSPGPNRKVWVEYFQDASAAAGDGNIVVHLYRESKEAR